MLFQFYDITSISSFENLGTLLKEVRRIKSKYDPPFVIVGTKVDLAPNRAVPFETAKSFAKCKFSHCGLLT
jgi:hypothetical protein